MNQNTDDRIFKAVADSTRRSIIQRLATSDGELTVNELAGSFGTTRQAVTKHINILDEAGLIASRRVGRERYCRPTLQSLQSIYQWAAFYEQFWTGKLKTLGRHLDDNPE